MKPKEQPQNIEPKKILESMWLQMFWMDNFIKRFVKDL